MKVLIVDDDAMARMLLADLLHQFEEVEVVEAADGDAAWKVLQDGLCPVLCFCDMRMPGMSGLELLRHFKSRAALAGVPFIFITSSTGRSTIEEAIASGATNYIIKPFDLARVRTSIQRLLRDIRARYSEQLSATQKRLDVSPVRLLGYFDTFRQQLTDARSPVHELLASGDVAPARDRLDSLRTGCAALGLWHAAAMIEHMHVLEADPVEHILKDIEAMVDEQMLHLKTKFGLREPREPEIAEATAQASGPAVGARPTLESGKVANPA